VTTSEAVATVTLAQTLQRHVAAGPTRPAVTAACTTTTYGELADRVARLAAALAAEGLGRGDRVALLARNGTAFPLLLEAASWSGVVLVGINWRLTASEVAAVLDDSEAKLVVADREWASLVGERRTVWVDDLDGWAEGHPPQDVHEGQGPSSIVLQLYTTGTTGEPKGVQLSETNLHQMCVSAAEAWLMHPEMRFLAVLPTFHVSGMSSYVTAFHVGGEVVVPDGASAEEVCSAIERHRVTHTVIVPTVLTTLVADKAPERHDLSSLEVLIYGSAPSGSRLVEEAMAMLPATGFSQGYGLTETSAGVAIAPIVRAGQEEPRAGSVGRMLPSCEVRVVDPTTGVDVPTGSDGEIWLRTPQLTVGYWRKPELTAAAIDEEGWFRTGDIGCVDEERFLFIRDRLKDVIISGGENIYTVEVENAVSSHPAVLEVAVVGAPHPHWGETVRAVVVRRDGCELDEPELRAWLQPRLARYKQPRQIDFTDELPKTGSGKILKRVLREEAGQ
jgi:long-chain acyl-CoA synthetase